MSPSFARRASEFPLLGKERHENLPPAALYEHAIRRAEAVLAANGPLVVRTGEHTGRSPKDKYIVDEADAHEGVWWGGFNQPISEARYDQLRQRFIDHMNEREVFVQDCYVGADPRYRRRRARLHRDGLGEHLLRQPVHPPGARTSWTSFVPNFTIIDAPIFQRGPRA